MDECKCKYEKDMGALMATVKNHDKVINGNGQKGMVVIVSELNTKLNTMQDSMEKFSESIEAFRITVSGFNKFQTQVETEVRVEEKQKADGRVKRTNWQWFIGVAIGVIIFLIEKFL